MLTKLKSQLKKIGDIVNLIYLYGQRNFFLYDNSNFISNTLVTELNKKIQLYGEISTDGLKPGEGNKLITFKNPLRFTVTMKKLKEKIILQLEDIRSKQKTNISDNKIKNLTMISQERKNKIVYKKKMNYEIIDEIHFIGLEKFVKYDKLNPISITIQSNDINAYLTRYSKYKYRFIITGLLFNTSLTNETFVIYITTNRLVDSRKSIIDRKNI